MLVSWPECRPEFLSDGDNIGDVPTTLLSGLSHVPWRAATEYTVRGPPHFDRTKVCEQNLEQNFVSKDCGKLCLSAF